MVVQSKPSTNWAPLIIVPILIALMWVGSSLNSGRDTEARQPTTLEDIDASERFHCGVYGEPSREGMLMGFECP